MLDTAGPHPKPSERHQDDPKEYMETKGSRKWIWSSPASFSNETGRNKTQTHKWTLNPPMSASACKVGEEVKVFWESFKKNPPVTVGRNP